MDMKAMDNLINFLMEHPMEIGAAFAIAVAAGIVKAGTDHLVKKREKKKDWIYWVANGVSFGLDFVTFKSDKRK